MYKKRPLFGAIFCYVVFPNEKAPEEVPRSRKGGLYRGASSWGAAGLQVSLAFGVGFVVQLSEVGLGVGLEGAVRLVVDPGEYVLLRTVGKERDHVPGGVFRSIARHDLAIDDRVELMRLASDRERSGRGRGAFRAHYSHLLDVDGWNEYIIAHIYKNSNIQYTSNNEENSSRHLISRHV